MAKETKKTTPQTPAKAVVMQVQFRSQKQRLRTKYTRRSKHKGRGADPASYSLLPDIFLAA